MSERKTAGVNTLYRAIKQFKIDRIILTTESRNIMQILLRKHFIFSVEKRFDNWFEDKDNRGTTKLGQSL